MSCCIGDTLNDRRFPQVNVSQQVSASTVRWLLEPEWRRVTAFSVNDKHPATEIPVLLLMLGKARAQARDRRHTRGTRLYAAWGAVGLSGIVCLDLSFEFSFIAL